MKYISITNLNKVLLRRLFFLICCFSFFGTLFSNKIYAQTDIPWPMAGADPQRTSHTSAPQVTGSTFLWYRPIQPYIPPYVQLIAANNLIYASTAKGLLALNATTGAVAWTYTTEMPLGNSPTIYNGVAYVGGFDHKLHAINATTGVGLWTYDGAGAGYDTNPVVVNNTVYLGNRDGYLYAIYSNDSPQKGQLRWRFKTNGSITMSAAISTDNNTLYVASNDSYAYALQANCTNLNGCLVWKSTKLPGLGFRNWWPVVFGNYVIIVGTTPYRYLPPGGGDARDLQNLDETEFFRDYVDIGTTIMGGQDLAEMSQYLTTKPDRRTYFVLNAGNGQEATFNVNGYTGYAPFAWYGTRAGTRYPPIVLNNNLYQVTGYIKSSPPNCWNDGGTTVCTTRGGVIGWNPSNPGSYINANGPANNGDEPMSISSSGNAIYFDVCCDRRGGVFSTDGTLSSIYWDYNLRTRLGDEYATYYWGWGEQGLNKLYGSSNGVYGLSGDNPSFTPYQGRLYIHRSNSIIAIGTGTASYNLGNVTFGTQQPANMNLTPSLNERLNTEIDKMIAAGHLRPAFHISGISDRPETFGEAHADTWHNTGELLYVLSRAYQFLDSARKSQLRNYLTSEFNLYRSDGFPEHMGWNTGASRQPYDLPIEVRNAIPSSGPHDSGTAWQNFAYYGLWKYAALEHSLGNTSMAATILDSPGLGTPQSSTGKPYLFNSYIAGYQGYLGLLNLAGRTNSSFTQTGLNNLMSQRRNAMTATVGSTTDPEYGGFDYTHSISAATNFLFMTKEFGDYINPSGSVPANVSSAHNEAANVAPYWFVGNFGAAHGEAAIQPMWDVSALFMAKAYVLKQYREDLAKYIDSPVTTGDLYYLNNIVAALEAPSNGASPAPSGTPTPSASPCGQVGDVNNDCQINVTDLKLIISNLLGTGQCSSLDCDLNQDNKVNVIDAALVILHWTN